MYVTGEQAVLITLGGVALFGVVIAVIVLIQDWQVKQKQHFLYQKKA